MKDAPNEILQRWGLSILTLVADTGQAKVYKVVSGSGRVFALKIYRHADRGNEAAGIKLMVRWRERGAVHIVHETANAILMEWLDGPTLGALARDGKVGVVLAMLADTARRLHQDPVATTSGLKSLNDVFAPLFACQFSADCPGSLAQNIKQAAGLAHTLLYSQQRIVPLHGDLHPDNVILTDTGPRIIDAKGYFGDPAFELANAFRHPKGMPDVIRQLSQVRQCRQLYSQALNVSPTRLMQWAAAKCALSICWRSNGTITSDSQADLLSLLLNAADQ
ncbi:aminoglycoside phosphotransferase family protein [Ruegeria halocynthiae]|uniref:aminoglycoside phosphotransferase family protein n=1 Tax=Ruegeria halocynthiae TaxID=985054 RepID=UPI00055F48DB|nr:aminoglycoside phosphotransferase family protein [Ruegeria halocynthiae]